MADDAGSGPALLVYDGDCAFCTRCVVLAGRLGTSAQIVAWQATDLAALGVSTERAVREVLWVTPQGRVSGGVQAVAMVLWDCGGLWRIPAVLLRLPPLRWIAAGVYRLVARNRHRMPGGTTACRLHGPVPGAGPRAHGPAVPVSEAPSEPPAASG